MSVSTRLLSVWQLLASSARAREGEEMEARVFLQLHLEGDRSHLGRFLLAGASHRPTHTPGAGITRGVTTSRESSLISWKPTQRVGVEMGEQLLPTAPVQVRMAAAWSRVEAVSGQIRPLFEDAESDLWAVKLRRVLV